VPTQLENLVLEDGGHTIAVTDPKTLARLRKVLAHVGAPGDAHVVLGAAEIAIIHARRLALISRMVSALWWRWHSGTHRDRSQNSAGLPWCGTEWCTSVARWPHSAQRGCSCKKAARACSQSRS
jgi:hypothetical protein